MPTSPIDIVDRKQAVQYTGTNSADIDGLITQFDITSEVGGVLNFDSAGSSFSANTNDWIVYFQGMVFNTFSPSAFNTFYSCNALCDDVTGGLQVLSVGVAETPLLLAGASAVVAVTLVPAMPDSSFNAYAQLFGAANILASLSITGVSVVDADTVNVTVQNTGLLTLGGAHVIVNAQD